MKKLLSLTALTTPLMVKAEGQHALSILNDVIDFVFIFVIWVLSVGLFFILLNKTNNTISKNNKIKIWFITATLAFFIWLMIKHDPLPFEGPIDNLFN